MKYKDCAEKKNFRTVGLLCTCCGVKNQNQFFFLPNFQLTINLNQIERLIYFLVLFHFAKTGDKLVCSNIALRTLFFWPNLSWVSCGCKAGVRLGRLERECQREKSVRIFRIGTKFALKICPKNS